MKRIRIIHHTDYHYYEPVTLGPHRALLRPREGHDLQIESAELQIEPQANVRWHRDIYGNSIAVLIFSEPTRKLSLHSEISVSLSDGPAECLIEPSTASYPIQYAAGEQVEIVPIGSPAIRTTARPYRSGCSISFSQAS